MPFRRHVIVCLPNFPSLERIHGVNIFIIWCILIYGQNFSMDTDNSWRIHTINLTRDCNSNMKNYLNPYSNITTVGSPFPIAAIRSSSKLQSSKRGSIQNPTSPWRNKKSLINLTHDCRIQEGQRRQASHAERGLAWRRPPARRGDTRGRNRR